MEEDIDAFKERFVKEYGVTAGYKLRYPGEALSEDDEPGKGGLADLIADSPPQTAAPGTSRTGSGSSSLQRQILTARAAMVQRESQNRAGWGAKRKTGLLGAPLPKKTRMPSAALGRAPPEGDAETSLTPVAPLVERAVATRVLESDSLEAYLIGQEVSTPKAVPEPTLLTGQEDIALPSMGGFLAELRGRVPKGGKRGTVVPTPIPRRSAEKWKPVLGKPTILTATAASMLMPQQKTTEEEAQSSSDPVPMETVVEAPAPLVEVPMAEIASKGTKVQLPGVDEPSLPDSTRVTTERTDPVVAEVRPQLR